MKNNLNIIIAIGIGALSVIAFILFPNDRSLEGWKVEDYYSETITNTDPVQTSLIFGGDVMLARTVEQKMLKYQDWTRPFLEIAEQFSQADIAFINLESPLYDGGSATPNGSVVFRALPQTIEGINLAGIDIVTLANNHFGDQGTAGMEYTMNILSDNNIEYCGAGFDSDQSHHAVSIERNGLKFAYLGYAYPNSNLASTTKMGTNNMDIDIMIDDVNRAGQQADLVIVSMHSGAEYVYTPGQQQIDFARAAIDAGADLVIGHHPHVVQTYEQYEGGHIFYSLGNFVFDQEWSVPTTEGVVVKVTLQDKNISNIEFKPIKIVDYHQPTWGDKTIQENVLARLIVDQTTIDL
ncbi:MAG: CapA family protein [Patescibacteria group bacterium]